jgi:ketosteroid isomerase-like protein
MATSASAVERFLEALHTGDADTCRQLLAQEAVHIAPAANPTAGQITADGEHADSQVAAITAAYFSAINEERWSALADLLHEDAELVGVGGLPRKGRATIIEGIRLFMRWWAEHHDEPVRTLVCGQSATVEIEFTGTTNSGTPAAFAALDVFDIDDGRIRRINNWLDLDEVRRQRTAPSST